MLVKTIFPGDLRRLRPVIDFLKLAERLIHDGLNVTAGPHDAPFLLFVRNFSKTVVFKSVPNQPHFKPVIKFEIQPLIWRLIWSYTHRINIRPEEHVLLLELTIDRGDLLSTVFIGLVDLALDLHRLLRDIWLKFLFF